MTDAAVPPLSLESKHGVSRLRRAIFAFLVTLISMMAIVLLAWVKLPVSSDIITNAQHVLGDIGTFIGVAYIGGSVIDYSRMFGSLSKRMGIDIPFLNRAPGGDGSSDKPDDQ